MFTKLDNKKAVAVGSNNLGNTMLTIYRTMVAEAEKNDPFAGQEVMLGMTRRQVDCFSLSLRSSRSMPT